MQVNRNGHVYCACASYTVRDTTVDEKKKHVFPLYRCISLPSSCAATNASFLYSKLLYSFTIISGYMSNRPLNACLIPNREETQRYTRTQCTDCILLFWTTSSSSSNKSNKQAFARTDRRITEGYRCHSDSSSNLMCRRKSARASQLSRRVHLIARAFSDLPCSRAKCHRLRSNASTCANSNSSSNRCITNEGSNSSHQKMTLP